MLYKLLPPTYSRDYPLSSLISRFSKSPMIELWRFPENYIRYVSEKTRNSHLAKGEKGATCLGLQFRHSWTRTKKSLSGWSSSHLPSAVSPCWYIGPMARQTQITDWSNFKACQVPVASPCMTTTVTINYLGSSKPPRTKRYAIVPTVLSEL